MVSLLTLDQSFGVRIPVSQKLIARQQLTNKVRDFFSNPYLLLSPKSDCPELTMELCNPSSSLIYAPRIISDLNTGHKRFSVLDPGAPSREKRMASLKLAYERGFHTSVSIEPMLDNSNIFRHVANLCPFVTDSIWIGKLNNIRSRGSNTVVSAQFSGTIKLRVFTKIALLPLAQQRNLAAVARGHWNIMTESRQVFFQSLAVNSNCLAAGSALTLILLMHSTHPLLPQPASHPDSNSPSSVLPPRLNPALGH
jgi:hypothetical protein